MVARDLVEFVAVDQVESTAVGDDVDRFILDPYVAECGSAIVSQRFVVVSRDDDYLLAVSGGPQKFLHDDVLRSSPVDTSAHRPEVDDVPNEKGQLWGMLAKRIEKPVGLAGAASEVNVE